jgi:hypothetical protein
MAEYPISLSGSPIATRNQTGGGTSSIAPFAVDAQYRHIAVCSRAAGVHVVIGCRAWRRSFNKPLYITLLAPSGRSCQQF